MGLLLCLCNGGQLLWWDAAHFCGDLPPLLQNLSQCLEPCKSLSQDSWCSFKGGECLLWCEDFLFGESVFVFGKGVQGDFPLDLEGSPFLLVELGASPWPWEY